MGEQSIVPERIWAWPMQELKVQASWSSGRVSEYQTEYIRAEAREQVSVAEAAQIILANRWGGYGSTKAMSAMWDHFHDEYDRRPFPQSHYDGAFQAALKALIPNTPPKEPTNE